MADIRITESHQGVIRATVGDTLLVQLPETPTTGFRWERVESQSTTLEFTGDDFHLSTQSSVGGGGLRQFSYTARQSGTATLQFRLARSWESGPGGKTFEVAVEVTP